MLGSVQTALEVLGYAQSPVVPVSTARMAAERMRVQEFGTLTSPGWYQR